MKDSSRKAVSPVIAVILMVAVTVILSAVVGAFVFNLGSGIDEKEPQSLGVRTTVDGENITTQVVTGEADGLKLLVNGSVKDSITDVNPGDTLTANVTPDSDVTIVSTNNGEDRLISTSNPMSNPDSKDSIPSYKKGMLVHYTFDSGSGGTLYDVENGYDGDINGAKWVSYADSYALDFDGTNDNVTSSTSSKLHPHNLTVSVWVYHHDATKDWMVVEKGVSQSGTYYLYDTNTHSMQFTVKNSTSRWDVKHHTSNLKNKTWYHLVGTHNNSTSTLRLYVNGTEVGNLTGTNFSGSNSNPLTLGDYESSGYHLDGKIRDVRIYNRTLSEQEIKDLYQATK